MISSPSVEYQKQQQTERLKQGVLLELIPKNGTASGQSLFSTT